MQTINFIAGMDNTIRVEQIDVNSHPKENISTSHKGPCQFSPKGKHIYLSQRSHLTGPRPHKTMTNYETYDETSCSKLFLPGTAISFAPRAELTYLYTHPRPTPVNHGGSTSFSNLLTHVYPSYFLTHLHLLHPSPLSPPTASSSLRRGGPASATPSSCVAVEGWWRPRRASMEQCDL
jgi:hypothetical protein